MILLTILIGKYYYYCYYHPPSYLLKDGRKIICPRNLCVRAKLQSFKMDFLDECELGWASKPLHRTFIFPQSACLPVSVMDFPNLTTSVDSSLDLSSFQPWFQHPKEKQDQKTRIPSTSLSSTSEFPQSNICHFVHLSSCPRLSLCCNNFKISFTPALFSQTKNIPKHPDFDFLFPVRYHCMPFFVSPLNFPTASPLNFQAIQV